MEDLLWRFPDDFFAKRGHRFTPAAKQFTLSDGGRLDISFRDASERLWVVEVKAAPLRIGVADQVYGYWQRLKESRPNEILFPAVVAPVINSIVEEQLIRWGIESFQISEAEFRRVATERGVEMESTEPTTTTDAMTEGIQRGTRALSSQATHALYVYKELASHEGAVTTITLNGTLFPVVHYTYDGKVALDNHNLRNVDKLTSLKRNWVFVESAPTCKRCVRKLSL
jgi:hypothetical protein